MAKKPIQEKVNILIQEMAPLMAKELLSEEIHKYARGKHKDDLMFAKLQMSLTDLDLGNFTTSVTLHGESAPYILKHGSDVQKGLAMLIKARLCSNQLHYEEGLPAALSCVQYFSRSDIPKYIANSNLICGIICRRLGMLDESLGHYEKAIIAAGQTGLKGFHAMCVQNLNETKFELLPLDESIAISNDFLDHLHRTFDGAPTHIEANALFCMSDLYSKSGNPPMAKDCLAKASAIKSKLGGSNTRWLDYLNMEAKILALQGDETAMLRQLDEILQKSEQLAHPVILVDAYTTGFNFYLGKGDTGTAWKYILDIENLLKSPMEGMVMQNVIPLKIEYYKQIGDSKNENINLRLQNQYQLNVQRNIIRNRLKHAQLIHDLEIKEKENEIMKKDIHIKTQELSMASDFLNQKVELLKELQGFMNNMRKENIQKNEMIKAMNVKISSAINVEYEQQVFMEKIEVSSNEFITKLRNKYPAITMTEAKVCSLLRNNFSNKEIANLLVMSIRTVEGHRLRLRKKLNLTSDNSLAALLTEIN